MKSGFAAPPRAAPAWSSLRHMPRQQAGHTESFCTQRFCFLKKRRQSIAATPAPPKTAVFRHHRHTPPPTPHQPPPAPPKTAVFRHHRHTPPPTPHQPPPAPPKTAVFRHHRHTPPPTPHQPPPAPGEKKPAADKSRGGHWIGAKSPVLARKDHAIAVAGCVRR
jgi:hypothetical protein